MLAVSPAGLRDLTDALEFVEEEEDDEVEEERELEMFDETNDRLEHSSWRPQRLCRPSTAGFREDGWSCTFAHGEQRAPPVHLPCSRTWTRQCRRSLLSS